MKSHCRGKTELNGDRTRPLHRHRRLLKLSVNEQYAQVAELTEIVRLFEQLGDDNIEFCTVSDKPSFFAELKRRNAFIDWRSLMQ